MWKYLGHVFGVEPEHLPRWGKKNPFSHHHLASEKFTRSAAAPTLCRAPWQGLSSAPCLGASQQHSEKELDVAGGYNIDIRFGPLYRKYAKDWKSPPSPAGALRDALCRGGKESDWGVQEVYALNRKTGSGKRESLKLLWRRWVTNHPPV